MLYSMSVIITIQLTGTRFPGTEISVPGRNVQVEHWDSENEYNNNKDESYSTT